MGILFKYTYHSSTGGKWIVSGTYKSDEYAVRQSIKGDHVDHNPSEKTVLTAVRFDDAIQEAKVKAGFLPLIDEQRVDEADKIIMPPEVKERLQKSIADGYYFALDTRFFLQQHQVMEYLRLADNKDIFLSKRVYKEINSRETVQILEKFPKEIRLNIIMEESNTPFLRQHRFSKKHDDLIVVSNFHCVLSEEKSILFCTIGAEMKIFVTSVISVFTC